jgi:hypothetical protein
MFQEDNGFAFAAEHLVEEVFDFGVLGCRSERVFNLSDAFTIIGYVGISILVQGATQRQSRSGRQQGRGERQRLYAFALGGV